MKKFLIIAGYNFIALLALLFLAEIAVRLTHHEITVVGTTKTIFADSLYHSTHGLRPMSSGTTNGASVSVGHYSFRKSSTRIDTSRASWLYLGDSVTFGLGVENDATFSAIVQSQIDSVNILNPAASGYNVNNYWDVFRCLVIENRHTLNIRRVSVFWCLNDVYINVPEVETPGGTLRSVFPDFLSFIRTHSRLYSLTKALLFDRPKSYFLFDKSFYDIDSPEFQNAIQILNQMNDVCRDRNIEFDIVLLPYEFQLREGDFVPQDLLIETLGSHIKVLAPFPRESNKDFISTDYFLYGDGIHFSNLGHKQIAEFLTD